jgi:hypothetical protein
VLRTITSVVGAHSAATARAAARKLSRSGACVTGTTGVETQMIAASTGSDGRRSAM